MLSRSNYTAVVYYSFCLPIIGEAGFEVGLEGESATLVRYSGEDRVVYQGSDRGTYLEFRGPSPDSEVILYRSSNGQELVGTWKEHGEAGVMHLHLVPIRSLDH